MSENVRFCPVGGELEKRSQIPEGRQKSEDRIQKGGGHAGIRGLVPQTLEPQTSNSIEWSVKKRSHHSA
jgi:hypothetical protein